MEHGNAPAAGQQSDNLHQRIMNLPCEPKYKQAELMLVYALGHRDARHAAAELVSAALPAAACAEQGEAVAWYDPTNTDPGQSVTFSRWKHESHPHIYSVPLYASLPPPARTGEMREPVSLLQAMEFARKANAGYGYGPKGSSDEFDRAYSLSPLQLAHAINAALSASCAPKQTEGDGK